MTWLFVLGPVFFIVMIGMSLLAFAASSEEEASQAPSPELEQAKPLVLFEPVAWAAEGDQIPVDDLVSRLEDELRRRYEAAEQQSRLRQEPPHA